MNPDAFLVAVYLRIDAEDVPNPLVGYYLAPSWTKAYETFPPVEFHLEEVFPDTVQALYARTRRLYDE